MRLVSDQSKARVDRRRALDRLTPSLRRLTANLLRITRGAGHPHRLADELASCLGAMVAYRGLVGSPPSAEEIHAGLDPGHPSGTPTGETMSRPYDDASWERACVQMAIRRASLAMTAAMLMDQRMQFSKAETELQAAMDQLEEGEATVLDWQAAHPASVRRRGRREPPMARVAGRPVPTNPIALRLCPPLADGTERHLHEVPGTDPRPSEPGIAG